jgi:hypothetical protein
VHIEVVQQSPRAHEVVFDLRIVNETTRQHIDVVVRIPFRDDGFPEDPILGDSEIDLTPMPPTPFVGSVVTSTTSSTLTTSSGVVDLSVPAPPYEYNHLQSVANKYADPPHSRAEIRLLPREKLPIAENIKSAFSAAGWDTGNIEYLSEDADHYLTGIEIAGPLTHICTEMANALKAGGFTDVSLRPSPHAIQKTNPKYPYAQNTVRITVGYLE